MEAQKGGRRRGAEGRSAQPQAVLRAERSGESRGVGIARRSLEEEEGAGNDAQRLLDAPDDRLHDLLAGPGSREVARDVEERAPRAVGVVILDPLEHVGDPLLDGHEQRGEHDAGGERDHVLARRGHASRASRSRSEFSRTKVRPPSITAPVVPIASRRKISTSQRRHFRIA